MAKLVKLRFAARRVSKIYQSKKYKYAFVIIIFLLVGQRENLLTKAYEN